MGGSLSRRRRSAALAGACTTLALIAGCGSSSSTSGSVSATSYVGQVCTSVATWYRNIATEAAKLEKIVNAKSSATTSKKALEGFVSVALANTQSVASALHGAGIPKVANGQKIASKLVSAFETTSGTLKGLETKVAALNVSNAETLRAEVKKITGEVNALPLTLSAGLSGLSSAELNKATSQSTACKSVGARSTGG